MIKQNLLKQTRLLLYFLVYLYVVLILAGIIPTLYLEEALWERNIPLTIIGIIIGASLFISFIGMLTLMAQSFWPTRRKIDYLLIFGFLVSLFLVDIVFPEESVFQQDTQIVLFLVLFGAVILSQIISLVIIKKTTNEALTEEWNKGIEKLPEVDQTKSADIKKAIIAILILIVVVSIDDVNGIVENLVSIVMMLGIGVYVLIKYQKIFDIDRNRVYLHGLFLIFGISLVVEIWLLNSDFFSNHNVLSDVLMVSPFSLVLFNIIPRAYIIFWQEKNTKLFS